MPVKETCCTNCAHLPVCAFKGYIAGAQEAIDKLTIMTSKAEREYIHEIKFIKPINVECTNFMPNTTLRKSSRTTHDKVSYRDDPRDPRNQG